MSVTIPVYRNIETLVLERQTALATLSPEGKTQRLIGDKIIESLWAGKSVVQEIAAFDPSAIPLPLNPYYYLEFAIKIGALESVKALFGRYEEKRGNYQSEMRTSLYMEVAYRPIFWLGAVCDSEKVRLGTPAVENYIKIVQFLEEKLELLPNHQHPTPAGLISKVNYIEKFCKDIPKKNAFFYANTK